MLTFAQGGEYYTRLQFPFDINVPGELSLGAKTDQVENQTGRRAGKQCRGGYCAMPVTGLRKV